MTNRDFKDAFTDILRRIFCLCCPAENGGGGQRSGLGPWGTGGGGSGGSMATATTDRLNADYV